MGLFDSINNYLNQRKQVIGGWINDPKSFWDEINNDARDFRRKHANRGLLSMQDLEQTPEWEMAMNAPMGLLGAIRAFHGSPHKFDKFDLSHMGKGEGAQAYGWGGYVAEHPKTGQQYVNELSSEVTVNGKPILRNNRRIGTTGDPGLDDFLIGNLGDIDAAIADAKLHGDPELVALLKLKSDGAVKKTTSGYLYELDLRWPDAAREAADPLGPQHFLDWDATLSNQPTSIQEALAKLGIGEKWTDSGRRGSDIYKRLASDGESYKTMGVTHAARVADEKAASEMLRSLGIPGIRYLDAGSRGAGQGTSNYVVFDDALIELLKRNGIDIPK